MEQNQKIHKGWLVVAAGFGINLAFGVLYAWSVVSKTLILPLSEGGWGWTSAEASLPYALAIAMYALSMALAGAAQDKYGPRIIATIGGVLCGTGLIVASFGSAENATPVIIGFGLLTGLGVGIGYACATPAALKWFSYEHSGMVTGIVVGGFGLASAYIAPLTNYLIQTHSIEQGFRILGGAFLLLTVLLAQFIKNPPKGSVHNHEKLEAELQVSDLHPKQLFRKRDFYILFFSYGFAAFAGHMIIGHITTIAANQLASFNSAFVLVIILALGNASGRFAGGMSLDYLGRDATMHIIFIGQALMMGLLALAHSSVFMMFCAFGVGFFYGGNLAIFPTITANMFGKKYLGANYGILFLSWGVGGVFGAMSAGFIVDSTGSYLPAYGIAALLCLSAFALTHFFKNEAGHPLLSEHIE